MSVRFLGIGRETRFSPGEHAAGDAEILILTKAALERAGYPVDLITPECLTSQVPAARVVFSMCQSRDALAVLQQWEEGGVLVLNTPAAVLSCYRLALVAALSQAALPFPRSLVMALDTTGSMCLELPDMATGWWVKRGDVHAMQSDDVMFVPDATALQMQLERLSLRGIAHAVVQEHIVGQEIKFYAVRGHGVLHRFAPHGPDVLQIDDARLHTLVSQAGEVLGLDVYGGDCILTPDGELFLVDVNDWPSFRGCRPQAAERIAQHLCTQAHLRGLL